MASIIVHGGAGNYSPDEKQERGVTAAVEAGWKAMLDGGTAVDAVEAAVVILEDDPLFKAGFGSSLNLEGQVQSDASIMSGDLSCGAVGALTAAANPIRAARFVMERTDHVLMVGAGADDLARRAGLPARDLRSPAQLELYEKLRSRFAGGDDLKFMPRLQALRSDLELGTVGAAAVDDEGGIAAGTSTGGMSMKLPGRVGDSAVIGAGTYANAVGAVSATGHGEPIIRHVFSKIAVDAVGLVGVRVALGTVIEMAEASGVRFGIIGVDESGAVANGFNTKAMAWAAMRDGELSTFLSAG